VSRFFRRTRAIAHKELIQMVRDVRVIYLALGLPVVMLVIFGYAISLDVDRVPLAVVDQDHTPASRRMAEAFVAGGAFVREASPSSPEEAEPLLRRGSVKAVLVLPRGYQRDLARGANGGAQLLIDGSDGTVATIAMGDAAGIVQTMSRTHGESERASLSQGPPIRTWFNPAMRSAYNIVPGVIALILSMICALLTALTIAREWERGSMEQLFATPVTRSQIIVGKLVPFALLGFVQTLLVLTLGSWLFDVPIAGSLALLFGGSMLFVLCMLGAALLVSVATRSQVVAVQFALLIAYMPSVLLSGFLFPIVNMPAVLRAISAAVPARYYIATLRGVMLKGNGPGVLGWEILALAGFAAAVLTLAVARFRRRLE
jgi:ABC-2 type transport system permease protein